MPNDDAKSDPEITVTDELDGADVAVITDGLRAYDLNQIGYHDFRPLAVFVRDPQTGKVIGGLQGRSEFGLVYVAWFFLPEDWRRAWIGSRVLAMAEEEGRRRRCTRIALTTLSIEATGFYPETGLRCRGDDRLRALRPHALLHDEEALTNGKRPARSAHTRERGSSRPDANGC